MDKRTITTEELRELLRKACKKAGSQRKWALENKLSPQYINDVLQGNRDPSDKIGKVFERKFVGSWVLKDKD